MNLFNIQKAFITKKERGWNTLYVAVDAHGTMTRPYHGKVEFYPGCAEVMKWFNSRSDFKVILWTSSHTQEIGEIIDEAHKHGFHFDFINRNPLEKSSKRANFDQKFYFNILLDDKAGFEPETDWSAIRAELTRIEQLEREAIAVDLTNTKCRV